MSLIADIWSTSKRKLKLNLLHLEKLYWCNSCNNHKQSIDMQIYCCKKYAKVQAVSWVSFKGKEKCAMLEIKQPSRTHTRFTFPTTNLHPALASGSARVFVLSAAHARICNNLERLKFHIEKKIINKKLGTWSCSMRKLLYAVRICYWSPIWRWHYWQFANCYWYAIC